MEGEDTPGYDPAALYDRYDLARTKADSGKPKEILAAWREIEGGHEMPLGQRADPRRESPPATG